MKQQVFSTINSLYSQSKKCNLFTPLFNIVDLTMILRYILMYHEFKESVNLKTKRRQVLKDAQQLFVEKGVSATSVQDILTKADISKGTFYNYFSSKNECLIAILKLGNEETDIRRQELLIGQDPTDRSILVKQISVRLQVNVDYNLLPLFEAIFHSDDAELSAFAKSLHLRELYWLADRLVDVYGEEFRPYAADCSILFTGMLQHTLLFRKASVAQQVDSPQLINYLIRRMDQIIPSIVKEQDTLFGEELFQLISAKENVQADIKQQLLLDLTAFQQQLESDKDFINHEYTAFLLEEINRETPRYQLLKTITQSFRAAFKETPYEQTAFKLASKIWIYIQTKE